MVLDINIDFSLLHYMLANAFAIRLRNIPDDDTATERQKMRARNTQKALETLISFRILAATVTLPEGKEQFMRRENPKWEQIRALMRNITLDMKGFTPALRITSATDGALACRWHLGIFPIQYRFLWNIGLLNYLDDLKLVMKKKTSPIESRRLRIALRVISSI